MKTISLKKPPKKDREKQVLLGLVEAYLKTGKPIGSNTLRENGFDFLSSATIRNYFSQLEEAGFLKQQHSSGGRIPTDLAYKHYVEAHLHSPVLEEKEEQILRQELLKESREVANYLQHAAETLSEVTKCAVFLSAPRFDQDFVLDTRLISIDPLRCLCVLITDFGLIHTEVLHLPKKLNQGSIKKLEDYFRFRMNGQEKPSLDEEEDQLAQTLYHEVMLRHIVNYTHFHSDDIYRTGFSKLLNYPDFNDAAALASGLSLFENPRAMQKLLEECCRKGELSCFVGEDLADFISMSSSCSLIAIPYRINQTIVGAAAILGPSRLPYRELFGIVNAFGEYVSSTLTKSMYKFKISYRQPTLKEINTQSVSHPLIENKRR